MRIAATADIHLKAEEHREYATALAAANTRSDVLVIAGDLTNHGRPEEMQEVLDVLAHVTVPIVAVLGNHDYESGHEQQLRQMMLEAGVHVLDGESFEMDGVGFAGVKGASGGFTPHELMPFGELYIKNFVQVAIDEAARLDHAMAAMKSPKCVAVLHYAPIRGTVAGEPEAIFPFLGSSRLEVVLDRRRPVIALHGHAHHGTFSSSTSGGVPVFNVALQILKNRQEPRPFVVFEI